MNVDNLNKEIKNFLEENNFIIPNSQIYNNVKNSWDLGYSGIELKNNLKKLWWKFFVTNIDFVEGNDNLILTPEKVLKNSGHLSNFNDWFSDCTNCKKRIRIDSILEKKNLFINESNYEKIYTEYIKDMECVYCGNKTLLKPSLFNLLFKIKLDKNELENSNNVNYLRPETCQSIFVNFLRRKKYNLPLGVAQIGKSFRNEITLKHGIFRTREFEQMELEFFFIEKEKGERTKWLEYWNNLSWTFLNKIINNKENLKKINIKEEELAHYSKATIDFYYKFSFGWGEIASNSDRGNFDLKNHIKTKEKKDLEKVPSIIELSSGVERTMLAILEDSLVIENNRTFLKINPILSPFFVSIIPVSKEEVEFSKKIFKNINKNCIFNTSFEFNSDIGKSFKKQDKIGTFYCITIDKNSIENNIVKIRNRNNTEQKDIKIEDLFYFLNNEFIKFQIDFLS